MVTAVNGSEYQPSRFHGKAWIPCGMCVDVLADGDAPGRCPECNGDGVIPQPSQQSEAPERLRRLVLALVRSTGGTSLAPAAESFAFKVERFLVTGELAEGDIDVRDSDPF